MLTDLRYVGTKPYTHVHTDRYKTILMKDIALEAAEHGNRLPYIACFVCCSCVACMCVIKSVGLFDCASMFYVWLWPLFPKTSS